MCCHRLRCCLFQLWLSLHSSLRSTLFSSHGEATRAVIIHVEPAFRGVMFGSEPWLEDERFIDSEEQRKSINVDHIFRKRRQLHTCFADAAVIAAGEGCPTHMQVPLEWRAVIQ